MSHNIKLDLVSPGGPAVAYHVGCGVMGALYIHGGIDKARSTAPLNSLYRYNSDSGIWERLTSAASPSLSHHACVVIQDRFITLIGGWNGKSRISDVHVYDTVNNIWSHPPTSGFPDGAGLSSHTATLLADGRIVVIGREGSLRTQRRSASAFILTGNLAIRNSPFKYEPYVMTLSSRSGHTVCVVDSSLYVIGGRDDNVLEVHAINKSISKTNTKATIDRRKSLDQKVVDSSSLNTTINAQKSDLLKSSTIASKVANLKELNSKAKAENFDESNSKIKTEISKTNKEKSDENNAHKAVKNVKCEASVSKPIENVLPTVYNRESLSQSFSSMNASNTQDNPTNSKSTLSEGQFFARITTMVDRIEPLSRTAVKGRKHHIAVASDGIVLIHGGWTFDGKTRHPVDDVLVLQVGKVSWFKMSCSGVGRAGHICVRLTEGAVLIHGGEGGGGAIHGSLYKFCI